MCRQLASLLLLTLLCQASPDRWAPNPDAGPVNQRVVSGNACGPAALLAAFKAGSDDWQNLAAQLPGTSDRSKLIYMIRAYGLRSSLALKDRRRWTGDGINPEDLTAIAGELAEVLAQPAPRGKTLFLERRQSPERLLQRLHRDLRKSLKNGLPPLISLQRFVFREGSWHSIQGHFVTVVRISERFTKGARTLEFRYFDPWGGSDAEGTIEIPNLPIVDRERVVCLEAKVPDALIGISKVRPGQQSVVVPTFLIGRW